MHLRYSDFSSFVDDALYCATFIQPPPGSNIDDEQREERIVKFTFNICFACLLAQHTPCYQISFLCFYVGVKICNLFIGSNLNRHINMRAYSIVFESRALVHSFIHLCAVSITGLNISAITMLINLLMK